MTDGTTGRGRHRTTPLHEPREPVVLVAEDDHGLRSCMAEKLAEAGYDVVAVDDIDPASEQLDATPRVDLVVVDIGRPITGLQLLERIRLLDPGVPVIAITAHANALTRSAAEEFIISALLEKPVDTDELLCIVRRCAPPNG